MNAELSLSFTAAGRARDVSRAIEEYARGLGSVSALVVPWESDATTLSMAVTSVKTDGWAIEHTNLGTITLTDLGNDATRVAVVSHASDRPESASLVAVFDRFAQQLQGRFRSAP